MALPFWGDLACCLGPPVYPGVRWPFCGVGLTRVDVRGARACFPCFEGACLGLFLALSANWGGVSFFGLSGSCRVPALGLRLFWGGRVRVFFLYFLGMCDFFYYVGTAFQRGECEVS